MAKKLQQFSVRFADTAPYPLALQSLISFVLLATLLSATSAAHPDALPNLLALSGLTGLHLLLCWRVPMQRLVGWQQIALLTLQCGLTLLGQILMPVQILTYVYLIIVLQAIYLFRVWLWAPFAGFVWLVWSGTLMIASANLVDWLQTNLAVAFPITCIVIAAIVYARQHRRHEQVRQVLQQMQRQYDSLVETLRDVPQRAVLEERSRLAQTITTELQAALAQTEQSVVQAITQAQTNLTRLQTTITQTRDSATAAIHRLRSAVATLRYGEGEDAPQPATPAPLLLSTDGLMTLRGQKLLTWSLPLVFVALGLPLALLHQPLTSPGFWAFVVFCIVLLLIYVFTQRIRNPLLLHASLAGQVAAVLAMVMFTHAVPLLLGLLLVMWQIAMRLPLLQILTFVAGVQTMTSVALVQVQSSFTAYATDLLIFSVACAAVASLVGMARRRLQQRRQDEQHLARLAELTRELEQQATELRALAVSTERTRLAREFHDDLGHKLVLINVQLQLAEDLISDDPHAALDQLLVTRDQLRDAWSSVLTTVDAVVQVDGSSLEPALHTLLDHCRASTRAWIDFALAGSLDHLNAAAASTIYRAVQEGLTNACKYAQAQRIVVQVQCDAAQVRVSVCDDGHGATLPAPSGAAPSHGFGLLGLRERAALVGGHIEAGPQPGGGFGLHLSIPFAEAHQ